ncbi:phage tail sheath family protein [Paracraurococcus lichenis]|uniref:Phage tail sheath subtilisin-like domain-containing protein n=1 Tax=Paracraurococcus lichenis TaxID=3064888 RepID=A0ABT9EAG1_9PROT|nr:phage tail sheath C-terminal domain-containing protein [Paracraurococcus sp. LOR1-02]MDO9712905.1 phage tail sheath subtilisin-like domain-containing protein [Paracraurococcus sp. LOR1-02]
MPTYETPGLYKERLDVPPGAVPALRMDVTGFVGIAERGPLDRPVPVGSFRQFEARFGGFTGTGFLAYALKGFFDNGGDRAWVVRVASQDAPRGAAAAALDLAARDAAAPRPFWHVEASSPGSWGNALSVAVLPGRALVVRGEAGAATAQATRVTGTAGFGRDSLVRISQPGGPALLRICALAEEAERRLWWVHPEPRLRRPYDLALPPLNPSRPVVIEALSYTLLVRERGRLVASFPDLSLVPGHPRHAPLLLARPSYSLEAEREALPPVPAPVCIVPAEDAPAPLIPLPLAQADGVFRDLAGGRDGLARLSVRDFIGEPGTETEAPRGLQALARIGEVGLLAIPDIVIRPAPPPVTEVPRPPPSDPCAPCPPSEALAAALRPQPLAEMPGVFGDEEVFQVQQALVEHCEARRDRMALLDPPFSAVADPRLGIAPIEAWRQRFDTRHAALHFPWLGVVDPLGRGGLRLVPPSGHVAGQQALADRLEGVHRAAANRPLAWAEAPSQAVDAPSHGLLNTLGVNVIRVEPGRSLRILGARTLSSDPDARFVPVRRVVMLVIRAAERGLQWATFEPNDHAMRARLALTLDGLLRDLWGRGALLGATEEAAYSVRCDETNNPPSARAEGRLTCDIALAPSVPFEFVVLRVGRLGGVLEIEEFSTIHRGDPP